MIDGKEGNTNKVEKVKNILKYYFLIDRNDVLEKAGNKESEGGQWSCEAEKILWNSMWQCERYLIKKGYFGEEPTDVWGQAPDLVTWDECFFDFISRKIIIDNVAFDIYCCLKREIEEKEIKNGIQYIAWKKRSGYHEIIKKRMEDSSFEKDISATSIQDKDLIKQKARDALKNTRHSKYFKALLAGADSKYMNMYCLENKKKHFPIFDAQFFSEIIDKDICSDIDRLEKKRDIDTRAWRTLYIKIQELYNRKCKYRRENEFEAYENEEVLDNNIFLYITERAFRMRIIGTVKEVLEELHNNEISSTLIESSLIDFVTTNLSFGGEYLLKYPLKYIRNNNINRGREDGDSIYSVRKEEAERIWIDRYCKYLQTMKNIELPLVGNVVWANLYDYAKKLVMENSEKYQNEKNQRNTIKAEMAKILQSYLEKHLGCVVEDYGRFLKKDSKEKFTNFSIEYIFPEDSKDNYKRTVWDNNSKFRDQIIQGDLLQENMKEDGVISRIFDIIFAWDKEEEENCKGNNFVKRVLSFGFFDDSFLEKAKGLDYNDYLNKIAKSQIEWINYCKNMESL